MSGFAFFITPIGEKGSDERKRTDDVETHILAPVLEDVDLEIRCADKEPAPGKITEQIVALIASADLIIADLTGCNANVYYELGGAHA